MKRLRAEEWRSVTTRINRLASKSGIIIKEMRNRCFHTHALAYVVLLLAFFAVTTEVWALKPPFNFSDQHKYDDHQYGYVKVSIKKDGSAHVQTKFSNGKKLDGDNFVAITSFKDNNGKTVAAVRHKRGLNAAFAGATNEDTLKDRIQLTPNQLRRIKSVRVKWFMIDKWADEEIWKAVRKLAEAMAEQEKRDQARGNYNQRRWDYQHMY